MVCLVFGRFASKISREILTPTNEIKRFYVRELMNLKLVKEKLSQPPPARTKTAPGAGKRLYPQGLALLDH